MTPENEAVLTLPVLPLNNTVLFPHLFMPLSVGRPNSVAAVEAVLTSEDKNLIVIAQRDGQPDQIGEADLFTVGTRAVVKKMARGESGVELLVQGVERVVLLKIEQTEPFLKGRAPRLAAARGWRHRGRSALPRRAGIGRRALELAQGQGQPINVAQLAAQAGDPLRLAYLIGSMLSLDVQKEQAILEASTRLEALQLIHGYLSHELQVLELRQKINTQAQSEMTKQQRDYFLRQQMEAIQNELGEADAGKGGSRRAAPPPGRGRSARRRAQRGRARIDAPGTTAAASPRTSR